MGDMVRDYLLWKNEAIKWLSIVSDVMTESNIQKSV